MFSCIKYEHFVQVSSNQKHIFIMLADVRCGQESISIYIYIFFLFFFLNIFNIFFDSK